MILYHRTIRESAEAILKAGFRDGTGTYLTHQQWLGVWLSDTPLDCNDGAWGDVVFKVNMDLPESAIADYEWLEEGKPYREWCIPAALVNAHMTLTEFSEGDDLLAPPGAPHDI
jgi:hypothetical protein